MGYFQQLAENFATELIRPRKYHYSEEILQNFFLDNPHLNYQFFKAFNRRQQSLETLLVRKFINNRPSKTCIIYAHGLGSNKLQVLPILKHLKAYPYDICSFDFSGSGKSQGKYTTFGLNQKDDVTAILARLDETQLYEKYVVWGRSMGSVAIILSQGLLLNPKLSAIILDSPFSSFEKVSLQIASKKSFIPELFLEPLLNYLKEYFQKKSQFNPFKISVEEAIKKIDRKILFLYSKKDTIVNFNHSLKLKACCRYSPEQIQIQQDHNMQRSKETHQKVYAFIVKNSLEKMRIKNFELSEIYCLDQILKSDQFDCYTTRDKSLVKNRGISVISKDSQKGNTQVQSYQQKGRQQNFESKNAKINLFVTQSLVLNRKNSLKENPRLTKLKQPSSIKLRHYNLSEKILKSTIEKSSQKPIDHPKELISLNSVNTVESNNEQVSIVKQPELNCLTYYSSLDMTERFTQNIDFSNNLSSVIKDNQNQQNHIDKLKNFSSASFMDQNLNLLPSINSICINRKKNKENIIKEPAQNTIILKEKIFNPGSSSNIKRPSIQLRRRNRFIL